MKVKAYPKYKDSGVKWLSEVPETWGVRPIKSLVATPVTDGPHETPEIYDEGIPFVSAEAINNGKINFEKKRGYISEEDHQRFSRKYKPKKGDIFMVKSVATTGRIAMVETDIEFNIWSPLAAIRCKQNVINRHFLYFYMQSKEFQTAVELSWSYGTQQNIGMGVIQNLAVPVPGLAEQESISSYLYQKIGRTDELINKKRALIEKLKEKRTALISRTVTRGLPPEAARAAGLYPHPKLNPSGVEWFGDVPKHWEILKVRRVSRLIKTGNTPPTAQDEYYEEGTVPWYGPGSFDEQITLDTPVKFINESAVKSGAARLFRAGSTMVVGIGATLGKVSSIVKPASCNQQITVIEFDERRVFQKFGTYQLKQLETILRSIAPSATLPILSQGDIADIVMALPPLEEQRAITDFLDIELKEIRKLIEKIEVVIDRLQEYRTALITAAVTGKIDVSETEA